MAMTKEIVLGSGNLYIAAHTANEPIAIDTICTPENQLGLIQGGASLEYKPTTYEVKDDMSVIYKRFITGEEATLKSGILTWNLETLSKFIGNKDYNDDKAGKRTLKLGGNGAREMDEYVVAFQHENKDGSKITVALAATNDAGLSLSFTADKETVVDAEFKAIGSDEKGTLVIIEESYQVA